MLIVSTAAPNTGFHATIASSKSYIFVPFSS